MRYALLLGLLVGCVDQGQLPVTTTTWHLEMVGAGWTCLGSMDLTANTDPTDGNVALSGPWSCVEDANECVDRACMGWTGAIAGKRDAVYGGAHLQVTTPDRRGFFLDVMMNAGGAMGYASLLGGPAGFSAKPDQALAR